MGSISGWGTKILHGVAKKEKQIIFPRKSYEIKKMKTKKVVVKLCKANIVSCAHRDTFCCVI